MTNTELFDLWRARAVEDPDLLTELDGIRSDADAINDRFYRDLAFGTGGLRGVIGAGSNRMNIYTIRRATQGLADYINAAGLPKKVAIGHDSRHKGELFSREESRSTNVATFLALLELIRAGRVQVDDSGALQLDRTHRRRKDKTQ